MTSHTHWSKYWTSFLLFIVVLSLAASAAAQAKKTQDNDADQKELYNYVLTTDKLHKLTSVLKDLSELQKSNPQIADNLNSNGDSLDQMTKKMETYPQAVAILRKDGMTTREYVVGSITLLQAATAVGFKKAGTYKEYPPEMLKTVSQANLTFVEQHYDEITKTMEGFSGGDGADKK